LTPKKHVEETDSDSTSSGESQIPEKEFDASNFTNSFAPQLEDRDADRTLSSKIEGRILFIYNHRTLFIITLGTLGFPFYNQSVLVFFGT